MTWLAHHYAAVIVPCVILWALWVVTIKAKGPTL